MASFKNPFSVVLRRGLVPICLVAGVLAAGPASAAVWINTALPWRVLPGMKPAGPLPQTLRIPAKAWDYGAFSQRTDAYVKTDAVILRVDLQVEAGRVGVSLMTPDGSKLISKEKPFAPEDGPQHIFFRLTPPAQPSIIVLRNYDADGKQGGITITKTQFIRESDLSNDELIAIFKDGVF